MGPSKSSNLGQIIEYIPGTSHCASPNKAVFLFVCAAWVSLGSFCMLSSRYPPCPRTRNGPPFAGCVLCFCNAVLLLLGIFSVVLDDGEHSRSRQRP